MVDSKENYKFDPGVKGLTSDHNLKVILVVEFVANVAVKIFLGMATKMYSVHLENWDHRHNKIFQVTNTKLPKNLHYI